MTLQEIFTKVATHLLTQNAKAGRGGICRYRDEKGRSCAVGCLISDDAYTLALEGWTTISVRVIVALKASGLTLSDSGVGLLSDLQSVHDTFPVSSWEQQLKIVAENYELEMP